MVEKLLQSLYVDDLNSGADNTQEALHLYARTKEIMRQGGFNMRKWKTNCPEVAQVVKEAESQISNTQSTTGCESDDSTMSYAKQVLGTHPDGEKVLGVTWNNAMDTLVSRLDRMVNCQPQLSQPTKRDLLSSVAKVYDPMGLISPVVLMMKVLFQETCKAELDWDMPLTVELNNRLEKWRTDVADCQEITIPRCVIPENKESIQCLELHGFGDSSKYAYGAVVYLRVVSANGVHTNIIAFKSRVAPLTDQTIPRLELLSALILARLVHSIQSALANVVAISSVYCWLDSMVALSWIKGTSKEFKQFVQNRVVEIRKLVDVKDWNFCPGIISPADIVSRGMLPSDLKQSNLWWNGPVFLREDESEWPQESGDLVFTNETQIESEKEVKSKPRSATSMSCASENVAESVRIVWGIFFMINTLGISISNN